LDGLPAHITLRERLGISHGVRSDVGSSLFDYPPHTLTIAVVDEKVLAFGVTQLTQALP
jgi:hypothetical protein